MHAHKMRKKISCIALFELSYHGERRINEGTYCRVVVCGEEKEEKVWKKIIVTVGVSLALMRLTSRFSFSRTKAPSITTEPDSLEVVQVPTAGV